MTERVYTSEQFRALLQEGPIVCPPEGLRIRVEGAFTLSPTVAASDRGPVTVRQAVKPGRLMQGLKGDEPYIWIDTE